MSRGHATPNFVVDSVREPRDTTAVHSKYLTTSEAANYLRHSVSWLLRQGDISYLPGRPNLYAAQDLDDWYERNKWAPKD